MPEESVRAWFVRRILSDAVVIGFVTWLLLFVMELLKPGIVSFYLSLSRGLFLLLCLGLVSVSMQPPVLAETQRKHNQPVLWALSLVSALVIYKTVDVGGWLTLLLILVTVGSIWASDQLL